MYEDRPIKRISIEHFPDGILLLHNGVVKCASARALQLMEMTATQLEGLAVEDLPPVYNGRGLVSMAECLAGGCDDGMQQDALWKIPLSTEDEPERILRLRMSLYDDDGVDAMMIACRDVTEVYQQAEADRIVNEKLQRSQIFSGIASWEWNIQTNELFWSDAIYTQIGYEPGEIAPNFEVFIEITHPDDREAVMNAINTCMQDGKLYEVDHRLRRRDGQEIWIRERGNVVRDSNGKATYMLGVSQDITEQKYAEEALKSSEAQFRALFNSSAIGIALLDIEGHPLVTNPRLQQIVGYSGEELASMIFTEFTHPDDVNLDMEHYIDLVEQKIDFYQLEKRYVHKQGHIVWGLLTVSVIRNEIGKPRFIVGMVQDITRQKQMEAERIQLQRQVQQAQKMESIGMLTGGIAHDFNNILGSIMGHTRLLSMIEDRNTDKAAGYISQVLESGDRATELVQQLLAYSRGSVGDLQQVDPADVLKSLHKMLKATIPANIKMQISMPVNTVNIYSDPVQLHQAVMNLVINARDAMSHEPHGLIEMGMRNVYHDTSCASCSQAVMGDFVEVYVQDSGCGINAADVKNIFEPFFTTKSVGEGSGMGLSVVHGILHSSDGHILVEPLAEGGTVFRLLFPHYTDKTGEACNTTNVDDGDQRKHNVIVVDDELALISFMTDFLEMQGYQVHPFTDPTQALSAYRADPAQYDVIITDYTMPQMTGVELTRAIHKENRSMPVILITGYSDVVNENNAHSFGIFTYLSKPLDTSGLIAALESVLASRAR